MDVFGNKELIYRDEAISCFIPIPLRPRPRPVGLAPAAPARVMVLVAEAGAGTLRPMPRPPMLSAIQLSQTSSPVRPSNRLMLREPKLREETTKRRPAGTSRFCRRSASSTSCTVSR